MAVALSGAAQRATDAFAINSQKDCCDAFSISLSLLQQERRMVVCICNAIREQDLKDALRDGAARPSEIYARLGRRPKCGQCLSFAQSIITRETATA
jgi:bacterioferritin-associated ferredoxin